MYRGRGGTHAAPLLLLAALSLPGSARADGSNSLGSSYNAVHASGGVVVNYVTAYATTDTDAGSTSVPVYVGPAYNGSIGYQGIPPGTNLVEARLYTFYDRLDPNERSYSLNGVNLGDPYADGIGCSNGALWPLIVNWESPQTTSRRDVTNLVAALPGGPWQPQAVPFSCIATQTGNCPVWGNNTVRPCPADGTPGCSSWHAAVLVVLYDQPSPCANHYTQVTILDGSVSWVGQNNTTDPDGVDEFNHNIGALSLPIGYLTNGQ